jgi:hypothetical protein
MANKAFDRNAYDNVRRWQAKFHRLLIESSL